jgi:predicted transposase/invertase (TIGR01784 family)
MWDSNLKARWDYETSIDFAREEAEERGIAKGEHQKALEIAKELKKEGWTVELISKITRLSTEDIEKL